MAKKSDTSDSPEPAPETPTPEPYVSAQERAEQPTQDAAGRDLGPGESANTPDPSESIHVDDRFVQGSETVLMRGDRPDES